MATKQKAAKLSFQRKKLLQTVKALAVRKVKAKAKPAPATKPVLRGPSNRTSKRGVRTLRAVSTQGQAKPAPKPAKVPKAGKSTVKTKATKPNRKAVLSRILEVVVTSADTKKVPLVTPLPIKDVKNFGQLSFEDQASMILNTFPAHDAEIIGSTKNSGAGTVSAPKPAGS